MLSSVISGIKLLQELYNIYEELKSNAENCKRLCLRTKIFEELLLDLHNNQYLISPALHKPLEMLVDVLKAIQEFASSYYRPLNILKTVRRFVVNVAFRNSQAHTIAELNARINDCAISLGIVQHFHHDKNQQEDLEGFRIQLETCCEEVFEGIKELKDTSKQLKEMIADLKRDADSINGLFTMQLNNLEKKLELENKVSVDDLSGLQTALQQDSKEILKSVGDLLTSVKSMKGDIGSLLEGQQLVVILMEKILNCELLTQKETVKRNEILDNLRITSSAKVQFEDVVLGMGGFGEVRLGYYSDAKVAIKSIRSVNGKNKNDIDAIENELLLMHYLGLNPNILHSYGFWKDQHTLHIVLEFSPFGSLADILYNETYPDFTVRLILGWLSDLALALEFIHSKKVKHRDVKSENLLVFPDMKVKLCDFGLAKQHSSYKHSASKSSSGTTAFMAPEVMARKGSSFASDIYSLAMTFYQMIMRRVPSMDKSSEALITMAVNKTRVEFPSEKFPHLDRIQLLLTCCIELDPSSRPSSISVVKSVKEVLSNLGGDPRRKSNSEDRNYLRNIESIAVDVAESKIFGKEDKMDEKITEVTSSLTTTISAISSRSELIEKHFSNSVSSSTIPLENLKANEAVELLIHLGLSVNLRNRYKDLNILMNGRYLQYTSDIEVLQELEDEKKTSLRIPVLKGVLAELSKIQENGVPVNLWTEIKQRIDKDNQKEPDKDKHTREEDLKRRTEVETKTAKGTAESTVAESQTAEHAEKKLEKQVKAEESKKTATSETKIQEISEGILSGHSSCVCYVSLLSDGRLVSTSFDKTIRIWNISNVTCEKVLSDDTMVYQVIELSIGRLASKGEAIKIWNIATGACERTLVQGWKGVIYMSVLSDGRLASASSCASDDTTIKIWNVNTGICERSLLGHNTGHKCILLLSDGRLASAGNDETIKIWDIDQGTYETDLVADMDSSCVLIELSGGRLIAKAFYVITIWDIDKGLPIGSPLSEVSDCVIELSNGRIASGTVKGTVNIWNINNGTCERTLKGHTAGVLVVLKLDDDRLASASRDGAIKIWNINSGTCERTLSEYRGAILSMIKLPDGRLVSGSKDGSIKIWSPAELKAIQSSVHEGNFRAHCRIKLRGHTGYIKCVSWNHVVNKIASGSQDYAIKIWDGKTGALLTTLVSHGDAVDSLAWNCDGTKLVSGSSSSGRLWDASTGNLLRKLRKTGEYLKFNSVGWNHDSTKVVSGSDKVITIWDVATGTVLKSLLGHSSTVFSVAWSHEGSKIVSGSYDETVKVWDGITGCMLLSLTGHAEYVSCVAWNSDSSEIASCSCDKTVKIWNADTGVLNRVIKGHSDALQCMSWSPDGQKIATSGATSTGTEIVISDALTGLFLGRIPQQFPNPGNVVSWSPDGKEVACNESCDIIIWSLP
jgi:WD40 repeat protein